MDPVAPRHPGAAPVTWAPPAASGPPRAAPSPQRTVVLRRLRTTGLVLTAAFSSSVAMAYAVEDDALLIPFIAWMVGTALAVGLVVRHRFPVALALTASAAALLLPLDTFAALVALVGVVARRPLRVAVGCGTAVAVATGAALLRDHLRPDTATLLAATDPVTGEVDVLPGPGYVVIGVVLVAAAVGLGLLRRYRDEVRAAETGRIRQERVAAELRTEMTRQEERELIAREVHDTVAHQLSLVALHASSLRGGAPDTVAEGAESIREAADRARRELRDMVEMLRDPAPGTALQPAPVTLDDVPALLDTARQAGALIRSSVYVADAGYASLALTRAVYRLVQESLTNAVKHAPGAEVDITLHATPREGVRLRVTNSLTAAVDVADRGSGLAGMRERAALLGGTVDAGPRGDAFVVEATLPWVAATSPT
ncbi:sensor histidine kinase [Cellulomonas bogoriensis]|nr:histidine kinase [Cellulomonas bogoriensis]